MIVLNERVFDDFIDTSAVAYTGSQWYAPLGRPDVVGLMLVVDQVQPATPQLTVWAEHSGNGKTWLKNGANLVNGSTLSNTGTNVFALNTDTTAPPLGAVRFAMQLAGGGIPATAHAELWAVARDRTAASDDIRSDEPDQAIYVAGAAPSRSPRLGSKAKGDKLRRKGVTLTVFEEHIAYVAGAHTVTTMYSGARFNDILGRFPAVSVHIGARQTKGASPTLTCALEHSGDGRVWMPFTNLFTNQPLSTSSVTTLHGFVTDPLLGFVRIGVAFDANTTSIGASTKVRVLARLSTLKLWP
jgi:hypothetical protein